MVAGAAIVKFLAMRAPKSAFSGNCLASWSGKLPWPGDNIQRYQEWKYGIHIHERQKPLVCYRIVFKGDTGNKNECDSADCFEKKHSMSAAIEGARQ